MSWALSKWRCSCLPASQKRSRVKRIVHNVRRELRMIRITLYCVVLLTLKHRRRRRTLTLSAERQKEIKKKKWKFDFAVIRCTHSNGFGWSIVKINIHTQKIHSVCVWMVVVNDNEGLKFSSFPHFASTLSIASANRRIEELNRFFENIFEEHTWTRTMYGWMFFVSGGRNHNYARNGQKIIKMNILIIIHSIRTSK